MELNDIDCENKAKEYKKRELDLACENNMLKIKLNLAYAELKELRNKEPVVYEQFSKAKKILELAIKDIQTCMTADDCDVCAFDFKTCRNKCKWRYLDDALEFINKTDEYKKRIMNKI